MLFKFILKLGLILPLAFVVACTVFVIYCIIHGDIEIDVIGGKAEKKKNRQSGKEM